jgi:ABC-type Mn2+/Zn2+ transport system permease subunit
VTDHLRKRTLLLAAILLGAAPLVYGILRRQAEPDSHLIWMAVAATIFTAGVLAANIGRLRTRKAAYSQATAIFVVSALLAGATDYFLRGSTGGKVSIISLLFGALLSASSFCLWLSRSAE